MSDNPLSGKVGLDTTDFKTAVAELNREIRIIESGFRATAAGLADWSSDASGLEARIKALNGEIELQSKKVAALTAQYTRVAAEKGATSKAAQDLQIRLNKETETLNKMQGELTQTESDLSGMGDESQATGKDVTQLKKSEDAAAGSTKTLGARLGELGGKLKSAGDGIRGMIGKVAKIAAGLAVGLVGALGAAGAGLGALILKTAATSDELVELSDKTGLSVEQLQELAYIGEQTGTDLDTVTSSMARLVRSMDDATKRGSPMAKAFKELGVSVTDANGNLRDSQDVFADVIDALGQIENETERDALSMAIFGKSAQELNPLIDAGGEGMAAMAEEARRLGIVVSEDAVNAAADFNDKLAGLKAGIGGVVSRIAGAFIPAVTQITDKMIEWLSSPEVKEGIDLLVEAFGLIAKAIGALLEGNLDQAIGFFGLFGRKIAEVFGAGPKEAAGFASGIIEGLKDVKDFFAEWIPKAAQFVGTLAKAVGDFITKQLVPFVKAHGPEIKGALAAIGIALGVVAVIVPIVAAVIAALNSPILAIIAAAALLGAAWAGNWGGIRDTLTRVWNDTLKPALMELWTWLSTNIPLAIQALSNFWTTTLLPALKNIWAFIQNNIIPIFQTVGEWLATNIPLAIQTLSDFWTNTLLPAITNAYNFFNEYIVPILGAVADVIDNALTLAVTALAGLWENVLLPAITDVYNWFNENVMPVLEDLAELIGDTLAPKVEGLGKIFRDLAEALKKGVKKGLEWVFDLLQKLAKFLENFKLPDWLTPGSPTPFEMGLRGIAAAAEELNGPMNELRRGFDGMGRGRTSLSGGGTGGGGTQSNVNVNIQATVNNPLAAKMLAYQVAEEIRRRR